jgi:hypothetical protein
VTGVAIAVLVAWDAGGYFAPSYLLGGTVAFLALAALVLGEWRRTWTMTTHAVLALGALAGLTAWTGLAVTWSSSPEDGLLAMFRDLSYLGLIGLLVLSLRNGRGARLLTGAVLAGTLAIVVAGLLSRLYPGLIATSEFDRTFSSHRLDYPISYWNGYGVLAAMAVVLCLGFAAARRLPTPVRMACAAAAVPCVTGLYLSLSRGAFAAFAVGLVVFLVLTPHRGGALFAGLLTGLCSVVAVLRLSAYPVLLDGSGAAGAGSAFAPTLLGCMALAGLGLGGGIAVRGRVRLQAQWQHAIVRGLRWGGALLVVGAVAVYVADRGAVDGALNRGFDRTDAWINHQWSDFLQASAVPAVGPARLTSAGGTRSDAYRVALDGFAGRPVLGEGSGSFAVRWARERHGVQLVQNAHSLPLETLDELGVVGFALLVVFLGAILTAGVRACRRAGGLSRSEAAAVTAAFAVWIVHSAVDWDWQLSGVTGLALALGTVLLPSGRARRRLPAAVAQPPRNPIGLLAVAAGCLLGAAVLGQHLPDEQRLRSATELAAAGSPARAAQELTRIGSEPTLGRADLLAGAVAGALGRNPRAITLLEHAAVHRPNDWSVRLLLAGDLARSNQAAAAQRQFRLAVKLDPKLRASRRCVLASRTPPGC